MSKRTDYLFGRRGGRFVPDGYTPTVIDGTPRCDVCGERMILGQRKRHFVCDPATPIGKRADYFADQT